MKIASSEMWHLWEEGNFVGANRPHARVVITQQVLQTSNDLFRTQLFGDTNYDWYEIPSVNIKTLTRNHRVGTDASAMTLVMRNASPISTGENLDVSYDGDPLSPTKRELREQGEPGKFTYRRGLASDGSGRNPWGHAAGEFVDMFLPNRLVRTFEGYGTNGSPLPWTDTKMVLTGTWLIDRVNINTEGDITIECRDLAKLLIEQRLYPPIVPLDNYPIEFCTDREQVDQVTTTVITATPSMVGGNVARHSSANWDSSAAPWFGKNASVFGHRASHAFDGNASTKWISMRNSHPSRDWSYEWLDTDTRGETVSRIRFKPWKGNYLLYVCVKENGVWQGDAKVPYNPNAEPAHPNTADTSYVMKMDMPAGENWYTIDLPRVYKADTVRLTFTNLQDFGKITGGDFRAGVYEFEVMGYTPAGERTEDVEGEVTTFIPGNITDWTDIIKLLLAWSGFYWPLSPIDDQSKNDPLFMMEEWGSRGGRVWGDFFYSGAGPVEPPCIDASYWDNKSVMDGINQIKEILGFIGYVDATGGFVWRPPNIWANGNYITGIGWQGETSIPIVSENTLIMDYGITIDDASLRSEIIVVSAEDPTIHASYIPGYAVGEEVPQSIEASQAAFGTEQIVTDLSLLAGQQRIMLVPDYPFGQGFEDELKARAEIAKFAYLVSLWIHWSYRKGKLRIPANPALDVDDQIRIYEAKTSETYIHYILGMNVVLDMDKGTYVADINTHWLGNGPEASWHMFVNDLPPALLAYLCQQGILEGAPCGDPEVGGGGIPWADELPTVPDTPITIPRLDLDLQIPYPRPPRVVPGDPANPGGGWITLPSDRDPGSLRACSNDFMRNFWGVSFSAPSSTGRFYGAGGSFSDTVLDNRVWPAFRLLSDLFAEEGIIVHSASGKYIRYVRGHPGVWSNHAWGTANDVNGESLAPGKSIHTYPASVKGPLLRVWARSQNIRGWDVAAQQFVPVFYWGEGFRNPDPMHWQVCCKSSDLGLGVWNIEGGRPLLPL